MQQAGRDMRVHGRPSHIRAWLALRTRSRLTNLSHAARPAVAHPACPRCRIKSWSTLLSQQGQRGGKHPRSLMDLQRIAVSDSVVSPAPGRSASLSIEERHSVCTLIKKKQRGEYTSRRFKKTGSGESRLKRRWTAACAKLISIPVEEGLMCKYRLQKFLIRKSSLRP